MFLAYTLVHYFYPRHSNNHKAKLLHASTLLFLILTLLAYQAVLRFLPLSGVRILGYAANISPSEVISLTNQKRVEEGLVALEYNSDLAAAAKKKGEDMLAQDYWAHIAPDGTQPWKFFTDEDYKYRYAGENLARDFADPASAVSAWVASPSHRGNLLSPKYKEVGIAVVEGNLAGVETTIIVQFFGTRFSETVPSVPIAVAEIEGVTKTLTPASSPAPQVLAPKLTEVPEIPVSAVSSRPKILISPFATTRSVSLATIVTLLVVLVVDGLVVSRRKIARIGGRTFAHLAFLGMILAIVLIARAGEIL
jgi:hypothetical protein